MKSSFFFILEYTILGEDMVYSIINKNKSLLKIPRGLFDEIDIYDRDEIEEFVKIIIIRILRQKKIKGIVFLDIYIDLFYGMIIEIDNRDIDLLDNQIDIKITFHIDSSFLYEIDYFDVIDLNLKGHTIYYYENKFYLEINHDIDDKLLFYLLEAKEIIYKDLDVIRGGIVINI